MTRTTAADVQETLAALIIGGRVTGLLPTLSELESTFNVASATARSAVDGLRRSGLITQPSKGARYEITRPGKLGNPDLRPYLRQTLDGLKPAGLTPTELRAMIFDVLLLPELPATEDLEFPALIDLVTPLLAEYSGRIMTR